jgi:hypothetical protein
MSAANRSGGDRATLLTIHAQRLREALAVIRGTNVKDVRAPGVALKKDGMHDAGLVHNDLRLDTTVGQAQ